MKAIIPHNIEVQIKEFLIDEDSEPSTEDRELFDQLKKDIFDVERFGFLSGSHSDDIITINAQKHVVDEWKMNDLVYYLEAHFRVLARVDLDGQGCDFRVTLTQED